MIPFSNDSDASDWSKLCLTSFAVNGGGMKGFSNERYFGRQFDNGDKLRSFACQIAVNTIRPNISRIIPVITEIIMMLFGGVFMSVRRLTPRRESFYSFQNRWRSSPIRALQERTLRANQRSVTGFGNYPEVQIEVEFYILRKKFQLRQHEQ